MKIVVASCWAYRDAWKPFFALLDKFWPMHRQPVLITDVYEQGFLEDGRDIYDVSVFRAGENRTWCQAVSAYAAGANEPFLLFQEDFLLTERVERARLYLGLDILKANENIGCVRLYPCPGADVPAGPHPYYGFVSQEADYRISCQAALWRPDYLRRIAEHAMGSASSFEIAGTLYSRSLKDHVLAFNRDCEPWPLQYICSGISRGLWNPDSKKLCDLHGIDNDWSMRAFAS